MFLYIFCIILIVHVCIVVFIFLALAYVFKQRANEYIWNVTRWSSSSFFLLANIYFFLIRNADHCHHIILHGSTINTQTDTPKNAPTHKSELESMMGHSVVGGCEKSIAGIVPNIYFWPYLIRTYWALGISIPLNRYV